MLLLLLTLQPCCTRDCYQVTFRYFILLVFTLNDIILIKGLHSFVSFISVDLLIYRRPRLRIPPCLLNLVKLRHQMRFVFFLLLSDSDESGLHPLSLHLHHASLQQGARLRHRPPLQAAPGRSGWIRESGQDRSGGAASNGGQVHQLISALLGAGKYPV